MHFGSQCFFTSNFEFEYTSSSKAQAVYFTD